MRDRTLLHLITIVGFGGWSVLFRKGPIKDWFLVYLIKTLISTFLDMPVARKGLVRYPVRYLPKIFQTNIVFDYLIFPMLCVGYSQLTYKWSPLKTMAGGFLFSVPMTLIEEWMQRKTRLIAYGRDWNWASTLSYLTVTFWASRIFIASIRMMNKKRENQDCLTSDETR